MPSRWPSTGTRASSSTRSTSERPPRGMIRSMLPPSPASRAPTASRSAVGTIWTQSAGRPASLQRRGDRVADRQAGGERVADPSAGSAHCRSAGRWRRRRRRRWAAFEDHRRSRRSACASARSRGRWAASSAPSPRRADRGGRRSARPRRRSPRAGFVEPEPVDHPRRRRDVARIGVEDLGGPRAEAAGDGADRRAPLLGRRAAQDGGGGARRAAHLLHHRDAQHHEIVAVDEGVGTAIAEQFLDPAGRVADDRAAPRPNCRR